VTPAAGPTEPEIEIDVPDFMVPGFPPPDPDPSTDRPLQTALISVLGLELWLRCAAEWGASHCSELARIARLVDGLAPAATTSLRVSAGAGLRWLGVTRERDQLADEVATAIGRPEDTSPPNAARTIRLYGAAVCIATGTSTRRCTCHRDLLRDVSPELIELGLSGLEQTLI
jgi:hypothetical protein